VARSFTRKLCGVFVVLFDNVSLVSGMHTNAYMRKEKRQELTTDRREQEN